MRYISPKSVLPQNRENRCYYQISHIRISLGTKFHLKKQVWIFGPDLPKTGISGQEQQKVISPSNSAISLVRV